MDLLLAALLKLRVTPCSPGFSPYEITYGRPPSVVRQVSANLPQGRFKRNMPKKLEKKRQELFAKAKQRHHDKSVLPLRLTRCTFQKPVTRIPSHPGDVVRHR
ncbi:unnamed protein product [Rangifer tarandus platyrhynchus]|uniref:Uncharacterized protein n=2 Tax=Rangifer tarandus platyrhynchus TaxID=3082113 RepID=A0AC59ZGK4_RANTA|nr:unnamed protein product [Rangifer tarandus platyrhynchus]CAI9687944.1 unnamed protein product [Rangifer tarandus platyrhynchus]